MSAKMKEKKSGAGKDAGKSGNVIFTTGKRKKAVARASIRPGKGIITFNSKPLDAVQNETMRLLMQEPLLVIGDAYKKFNIKIRTNGGGVIGQAQAARMAIARGLTQALGEETKKLVIGYDRKMLVYDPRRTEPHKPPRSSQGPRRYKQKSKR